MEATEEPLPITDKCSVIEPLAPALEMDLDSVLVPSGVDVQDVLEDEEPPLPPIIPQNVIVPDEMMEAAQETHPLLHLSAHPLSDDAITSLSAHLLIFVRNLTVPQLNLTHKTLSKVIQSWKDRLSQSCLHQIQHTNLPALTPIDVVEEIERYLNK